MRRKLLFSNAIHFEAQANKETIMFAFEVNKSYSIPEWNLLIDTLNNSYSFQDLQILVRKKFKDF